jgi:hypothetical protein
MKEVTYKCCHPFCGYELSVDWERQLRIFASGVSPMCHGYPMVMIYKKKDSSKIIKKSEQS